MKANATFYAFKPSGKWKYEGRGYLPERFITFDNWRDGIITANEGKCPGMSNDGAHMTLVIVPDEDHPTGWPLMLPAVE